MTETEKLRLPSDNIYAAFLVFCQKTAYSSAKYDICSTGSTYSFNISSTMLCGLQAQILKGV
jgi:hypothetical protein